MVQLLGQIWRYRVMLGGLIRRDLRVRYAGSALGMIWALLYPLMFLLVYVIVFSWILRIRFTVDGSTGEFALYLLAGLLPWLAFQDGVLGATASLVENASVVKTTSCPGVVLVAGRVLSNAASSLVGLVAFLLVLLLLGRFSWFTPLFLPPLMLFQLAFTLGVGLVTASFYTFLRDAMPIVQIGMTMWFFLTPIFYPLSYVPQRLLPLYSVNPLQSLVTAYRAVLLEGKIPLPVDMGLACAWAAAALLVGTVIFARVEPGFGDVV